MPKLLKTSQLLIINHSKKWGKKYTSRGLYWRPYGTYLPVFSKLAVEFPSSMNNIKVHTGFDVFSTIKATTVEKIEITSRQK